MDSNSISDDSEQGVGVYRDGDLLVVERKARLPGLCVKCGSLAIPQRLRRGFNWRPAESYIMLFFGWLGALLLGTLGRERLVLELPLCKKHRRIYQGARIISYIFLLGSFPVAVLLGILTETNNLSLISAPIYEMFVIGLVLRVYLGRVLRATFICGSYGCLIGAGNSFLARLPQRPQRMSPE